MVPTGSMALTGHPIHQIITLIRQPTHLELCIGFIAGHTCGPDGGGEAAGVVSGWSRFYDGRANADPESDPASTHSGSPPDWVFILGILPSFCAVGWPVQSRHSVNIVIQVPRDRTDRCARQREIEGRTERGHVLGRAAAVVIADD